MPSTSSITTYLSGISYYVVMELVDGLATGKMIPVPQSVNPVTCRVTGEQLKSMM